MEFSKNKQMDGKWSTGVIGLVVWGILCSQTFGQTQVLPRMGDRVYVSTFLKKIFGPPSEKIVTEGVFNKPQLFGGPCDPYSQELVPKGKNSFEVKGDSESCVQSFFNEYTGPVLKGSSPLRSAAIKNVCEKLTACEECIEHANKLAENTKSNMERSFYLFYPFAPLKDLDKYKKAIASSDASDKKFNFYLNLFCQSEEWQYL